MSPRPVQHSDLAEILPLLQAAFSAEASAVDWDAPLLQGVWRWRWAAAGLSQLLPGVGAVFVDRRTAGTLRLGHVGPIGVHPEQQRRGCGRRLLQAAEAAARAAGVDALTLETDASGPARHLYA